MPDQTTERAYEAYSEGILLARRPHEHRRHRQD